MILHKTQQWLKHIHKRHPITHPHGWAMGCLLRILEETDHVITALHSISPDNAGVLVRIRACVLCDLLDDLELPLWCRPNSVGHEPYNRQKSMNETILKRKNVERKQGNFNIIRPKQKGAFIQHLKCIFFDENHCILPIFNRLLIVFLTHSGLVKPYGDMELGQHWLR